MEENIDIVILWVDGNDPEWLLEKKKHTAKKGQDANTNRYREWGTLKYLFRGIEKFAPWINKVYFVTCGHVPQWLNLEYSKLQHVRHEDFIPKEFLPTFSSRSIDLHLHRIKGLSEQFIYFNDDMFLTNYVAAKDFFWNGLPCDMLSERPIFVSGNVFEHNMMNNMQILSKYFNRKQFLKNNIGKILNYRYGKIFFYNLIWTCFPFKKFCGLAIHHLPTGYLKSTFNKVWELEEEALLNTVSNKFRSITDVNQFIFSFWNLITGEFEPINMNRQGKYFDVKNNQNEKLYNSIIKSKYKRICINDNCKDKYFEEEKRKLIYAFEVIFPEKSLFERQAIYAN